MTGGLVVDGEKVDGARVGAGSTTTAGVGATVGALALGGCVCTADGAAEGETDGATAADGATVGHVVPPGSRLPGTDWERERGRGREGEGGREREREREREGARQGPRQGPRQGLGLDRG